jgi:uncharacterized protein (TIGR03435 family)
MMSSVLKMSAKFVIRFLLIFSVPWIGWAQPVAFEVASVKRASRSPGGLRSTGCKGGPGSSSPVAFTCRDVRFTDLVVLAFGIEPFQLSGAGVNGEETFEISAVVPTGATRRQLKEMVLSLLLDRFALRYHEEYIDAPSYDLTVVAGGAKLRESPKDPGDAPTSEPFQMGRDKKGFPELPYGRTGMFFVNGTAYYQGSRQNMPQIVEFLQKQLKALITDRTGLTGTYDFRLRFASPNRPPTPPGPDGKVLPSSIDVDDAPTLSSALRDQLGLRIERRRGNMMRIVVDNVAKIPTDN